MAVAAAGIALVGLAGCQAPPPAPVVATRGYVRLTALASLHPGWADVLRLDAVRSKTRSLPASLTVSAAPLPVIPEPPPLPGAVVGLGSLASEERARIRQVSSPAMRRIDNLRNTLNLRDRRKLAEQARAIESSAEADILEHVNAARKQEQADKQAIMRQYHVKIRDAWLKQFALETQVAATPPGPAAQQAQTDLIKAKQDREALEAESKSKQEAVSRSAQAEQAVFERTRRARADGEVESFRRTLAAQTAREVRDSQREVDTVLSKLEPLEPPVARAAAASPFGQLQSPSQLAAAARAAPQPQIRAAAEKSAADLDLERTRLAAFIESDLKRRIDAAAARHNWKIYYSPVPGAPDLTGQMADILRGSWNP